MDAFVIWRDDNVSIKAQEMGELARANLAKVNIEKSSY